jgi:hypothetical protein
MGRVIAVMLEVAGEVAHLDGLGLLGNQECGS